MKAIFFGSPEIAAYILNKLLDYDGIEVVAVVTQPDKRAGRGKKLKATLVKELALKKNIDVLQPESLKNEEIANKLAQYDAHIYVVVAYGLIIPKNIINMPKFGSINVHASLLPKYRGAAPIQWAILNGEKITGVTIMQMDEGMDTGPILLQRPIPIEIDDTAQTLHDKIKQVGAELLIDAIDKIKKNTIVKIPQDDSLATYAPKLTKDMGLINFDDLAINIHNKVWGLYPWPMAYFPFKTKKGEIMVQIYPGRIGNTIGNLKPGEILGLKEGYLQIACKDRIYQVPKLKPQSSKTLSAEAFACGYLKDQ